MDAPPFCRGGSLLWVACCVVWLMVTFVVVADTGAHHSAGPDPTRRASRTPHAAHVARHAQNAPHIPQGPHDPQDLRDQQDPQDLRDRQDPQDLRDSPSYSRNPRQPRSLGVAARRGAWAARVSPQAHQALSAPGTPRPAAAAADVGCAEIGAAERCAASACARDQHCAGAFRGAAGRCVAKQCVECVTHADCDRALSACSGNVCASESPALRGLDVRAFRVVTEDARALSRYARVITFDCMTLPRTDGRPLTVDTATRGAAIDATLNGPLVAGTTKTGREGRVLLAREAPGSPRFALLLMHGDDDVTLVTTDGRWTRLTPGGPRGRDLPALSASDFCFRVHAAKTLQLDWHADTQDPPPTWVQGGVDDTLTSRVAFPRSGETVLIASEGGAAVSLFSVPVVDVRVLGMASRTRAMRATLGSPSGVLFYDTPDHQTVRFQARGTRLEHVWV